MICTEKSVAPSKANESRWKYTCRRDIAFIGEKAESEDSMCFSVTNQAL